MTLRHNLDAGQFLDPGGQFDALKHSSTKLRLPATAADEGRSATRRRMLKAGFIAYNDRRSTLACTVRDLSSTGAHLRVTASASAPDTFDLIIELDGFEVSCCVVWRTTTDVGVRFVSKPRTFAPKRAQVVDAIVHAHKPTLRRKPLNATRPLAVSV
jgi:PilZ domain